jgi:hypothetical protein
LFAGKFSDTANVKLETPIRAEFKVVNQRGKNAVIVVDEMGYSYSCKVDRRWDRIKSWRCSKRKQKKCPALLSTEDEWIISKRHYHTHESIDLSGRAIPVKSEDPIVQEYLRNY